MNANLNPGWRKGLTIPPITRFWRLVSGVGTRGCWTFVGKVNNWGYGQFAFDTTRGKVKLVLAHRFAYELQGNTIPPGLYVDHTCRNRRCVRPDHLRVVDARTNCVENNVGPWAKNAAKTECPYGHPYSPENTALVPGNFHKNRHGNIKDRRHLVGRECLTCYPDKWRHAIIPRPPPPPGASAAATKIREARKAQRDSLKGGDRR